ncbi:hypothetical protein PFLUV_G00196980 [Perca fluviatilis]|uniref:Uncharacterized protein n=1 Tax=Perca fluviatilis TaxID=8168 RepID=A0A6A5EX70_PERFL|nr:hypothetical protein PFLUV_G00196980 [Perca fluviatilis]
MKWLRLFASLGDFTKSWDNVAVLVDETLIPQELCSPILQTPTHQNIKQKVLLIRNKNVGNRQSVPEQRIPATPKNVHHRKPKKQFIEPEPYQKGFPPKRRNHSFVPVSSYPATVSYDPNTVAEQVTTTEDLESLHLLSSKCDFTHSTPKPYHPTSDSIERGQKDTPLQKTSDETIHAVEAGEGSEDTGLTATAPTPPQSNRLKAV